MSHFVDTLLALATLALSFAEPAIFQQPGTGPGTGNYDSVQTNYDVVGRVSKVYQPYSAAAGAICSGTCPGTVAAYDALSRPLTVTDGGGGTITYTYNWNDVRQAVGPAPTGENTKRKQLEYDGLGRLKSVCEVTAVTGSGDCGQNNSQTGFLTTYTYDLLNDMTGVSQNAQPGASATQARTYTFDMAGRMTSELNPETGTTAITYVYDSWDASCGTYTSAGDLVEKKDAAGNVTCLKYDALHRSTQITYPAGPYKSPITPTKCFVYDAATVNGTAVVNAKTRLAEAYTTTATSCPGTKTVDEGFSYSARGEVTDVWESTPNSGGYYHVNASYWANGKLDVLNGGTSPLPGLPAITYGASDGSGLDGEGRITKVNAATGQNPVTTVGYNVAQQVTGVTFGSLDSDAYTYDANTGRMTQYKFNMGTAPTTDIGALTWNANGTLQKLQITDQINTANSQTCTFGYDDLVRITSANCGTVWSQTFGLDPFGNLTKSGSASFQPIYNLAKNQYSSIPGGSTTAYDANGNLTNDVTHNYTWDADGNMLSTDGSTVTMIYDALNRMAEQTRGSAHTQIVYGPYGLKLALMNGQTLVNAFVKLPGGARAVYNSSGLAYYRHADHLGSSRLATTPSRTKQYDVAYAPYGEDYNGSGTQDLGFTDENQDTVKGGWSTNLYDFMLREYRTAHGRWTSPDPAGLAATNPANPQSWNRYAYVNNNPLAYVDPDGTTGCDLDGTDSCGISASTVGLGPTVNGDNPTPDFPIFDLPGIEDFGGPTGPTTDDIFFTGGMGILEGENSVNLPLGLSPLQIAEEILSGNWARVLGINMNPWILDAHGDQNGLWVGDKPGEPGWCQSNGQCLMWDAASQMWVEDPTAENILQLSNDLDVPFMEPCDFSDAVKQGEEMIDLYTPFDVPKEKWINRGMKLYDFGWGCR
jgi:RHS repeat-associated protein